MQKFRQVWPASLSQMVVIKAKYDHKVFVLPARTHPVLICFKFTSSLTVVVKIKCDQGTCILQNLLQRIILIFEAALIVHHATVTKMSWL